MQRKKATVIPALMLCLGLTAAVAQTASQSSSQAAPQTPATPLTAQEREFALQQFQTTRDNFLKSIARLVAEAVDVQTRARPMVGG